MIALNYIASWELCSVVTMRGRPLWGNNGHRRKLNECPLYPRKRTWFGTVAGGNGRTPNKRLEAEVTQSTALVVVDGKAATFRKLNFHAPLCFHFGTTNA
jgi:hypothetical protein